MKLNGKRVVITGGTSGIGYEIVNQLHSSNEIIVLSRSSSKLNALSEAFNDVITYPVDLANLKDIEVTADAIVKKFGSIDLLINNAASQHTPTFLDDDFCYESIAKEVNLNFTSICCLSYLMLPALLHESKSVILNINSGLGLVPKTSSAVYCGTKGALNLFSQSLGYQLENTNINVQQAFLALVDTAMTVGRGKNKLTAEDAASMIIHGVEHDVAENNIGKVKLLRTLLRISPSLAKRILKNN